MLGGDWGKGTKAVVLPWIVAAIAVAIACLAVGAASDTVNASRLQNKNPTAYPEHYASKCKLQEAGEFAAQDAVKATNADGKTETDKNPSKDDTPPLDYCDLAAQYLAARSAKSSADYALVGTALTGFGLLMIGLSLLYTRRALEQANSANKSASEAIEVTREIGQAQTRAYLSIKRIGWPDDLAEGLNPDRVLLVNSQNGLRLVFSFSLENSGETPAYDVVVGAKMNLEIDGMSCASPLTRVERLGFIGKRRPHTSTFLFELLSEEFSEIGAAYKDVWITIATFVAYRDVFQSELRWTVDQAFASRLDKKEFQCVTSEESSVDISAIEKYASKHDI